MNSLKEYIQERIEILRKHSRQLHLNFSESISELQAIISKIEELENNK